MSRRLLGLAALPLLAASTAACGDDATDPRPGGDATSIATTTASPTSTTGDAAPVDTYADVEPAPQALDASLVEGVEAFAIWADAEPEETPQQLGGGTRTADGEAVALPAGTAAVLRTGEGVRHSEMSGSGRSWRPWSSRDREQHRPGVERVVPGG